MFSFVSNVSIIIVIISLSWFDYCVVGVVAVVIGIITSLSLIVALSSSASSIALQCLIVASSSPSELALSFPSLLDSCVVVVIVVAAVVVIVVAAVIVISPALSSREQ